MRWVMAFRILASCLCILAILVIVLKWSWVLGEGHYYLGMARERIGHHHAAAEHYKAALMVNPNHPKADFARIRTQAQIGDPRGLLADAYRQVEIYVDPTEFGFYSQAVLPTVETAKTDIVQLQQLSNHNPQSWALAYKLAGYKAVLKNPQGAQDDCRRATRLNQRDTDGQYMCAVAMAHLGDLENALSYLSTMVRVAPNDPRPYFDRGMVRLYFGDLEGAVHDLTDAVRLDPRNAVAFKNRGNAFMRLEQFQQAAADYSRAVEIDPNYAYAWNNRGLAKSRLKDAKGAIADYEEALRVDPTYEIAQRNLAHARFSTGDLQGAVSEYITLLDRASDSSYLMYRADTKMRLGDREGARVDYEAVLTITPISSDDFYVRGRAKQHLGDRRSALAEFQLASRATNDPKRLYNIAVVRVELEDYIGGIADYTKALHLFSDLTDAYVGRGFARFKLQDFEGGAQADYAEALRIDPRSDKAYVSRALLQERLGNWDEAIADYNLALELNPKNTQALGNRAAMKGRNGDHAERWPTWTVLFRSIRSIPMLTWCAALPGAMPATIAERNKTSPKPWSLVSPMRRFTTIAAKHGQHWATPKVHRPTMPRPNGFLHKNNKHSRRDYLCW